MKTYIIEKNNGTTVRVKADYISHDNTYILLKQQNATILHVFVASTVFAVSQDDLVLKE